MEWRQALVIVSVTVAVGAALFVQGGNPDVHLLVFLLGIGVVGTVLTGYGDQRLVLCLGEAFAVSLGTANPLLGVLFQPVIAGMICSSDRSSLALGMMVVAGVAVGVVVFRLTLLLLLALVVVSAGIFIGWMIFEAWTSRQLSSGDVS